MFLLLAILNTALAFSGLSPAMAVRSLLGRLVCQAFYIEAIAKEMSQLIRSGVFYHPCVGEKLHHGNTPYKNITSFIFKIK